MHIIFQNNQYLGSYYFTRSADDPVASPESKASLLLLSSICIFSAIHELLHAAGFNHEHQRKSRDKYIWINKKKLRQKPKDKRHNYEKKYGSFDCPSKWSACQYDMCSIMHYNRENGVKYNMFVNTTTNGLH